MSVKKGRRTPIPATMKAAAIDQFGPPSVLSSTRFRCRKRGRAKC